MPSRGGRGDAARAIRGKYHNYPNRPFHGNWWAGHGHYHPRPGWRHPHWSNRPYYWWRWATAGAITGWIVGSAWGEPYYYDYGAGGNVYYEDNSVYVDGESVATADQYYDQASEIASDIPAATAEQADADDDWMSLGVFAVSKDGLEANNMLLQLAVSKEGILSGTLYNESTNSTRPVEGSVDKQTQRAAWRFADGKNPDVVMETGIYNLTENEATALIHFGSERTQTVLLVRLEDPDAAGAAGSTTEGAAAPK